MNHLKKSLLSLSFFIFINQSQAQNTILSVEEVRFENATELNLLNSFIADTTQTFYPFLALSFEDSTHFNDWNNSYQRFIADQKEEKVSKKIEKNVKRVYEDLHNKFLRKYTPLAYFDQIFETGTYNCVTAVALYAITFDALNIPYKIKETPTHVYIIADPENSQLLIETTDPIKGFKEFTPGFKESFVTQLAMMKLVSSDEVREDGIYNVFDKYYFGGAKLTIKELVGIQYYNQGISLFEEQEFQKSFHAFSKAQLFHNNKQIDYMLYASLINTLTRSHYEEWETIRLTVFLERMMDQGISENDVIGEMGRLFNILLVENRDEETAEKAFEYFLSKVKSEDIRKEVSYNYYYEKTVISYNRGNYKKAFPLALEAFKENPDNLRAESLLLETFKLAYRNRELSSVLGQFDTLSTEFPKLLENNNFNSLRLNIYLAAMGQAYEQNDAKSGNSLKIEIEKILDTKPEYFYNEEVLGSAYSNAAVYYFKKGYTSKAKSILRKGLAYSPDNYQLKTRLRMINY